MLVMLYNSLDLNINKNVSPYSHSTRKHEFNCSQILNTVLYYCQGLNFGREEKKRNKSFTNSILLLWYTA